MLALPNVGVDGADVAADYVDADEFVHESIKSDRSNAFSNVGLFLVHYCLRGF